MNSRVRRWVVVVVALAAVTSLAVGVAAGQPENETTTTPTPQNTTTTTSDAATGSDWEPPGPFTVTDLKTGGTHDPDAPDSVRSLYADDGETPFGGISVRYTPISPLDNDQKYLEPGQKLETDTIQLYSNAYGDAAGQYELVIVYWQPATKTVNGSTVEYAANQSVQRVSLDIEEGYATVDVSLYSQYESGWQATMWLERNGERVPGARWRFHHKSNPLTAAPPFPVNSKGDLQAWGFVNWGLPGVLGLILAGFAGRHFNRKTIVGPQRGLGFYLLGGGLFGVVLLAIATWQTAAILARAPYVAGMVLGAIAFVVYIATHDTDIERVGFFKRSLSDATDFEGEDTVSTRKVVTELKDVVRQDNTIYIPAKGVRPWLARYWAKPAQVDQSDLETVDEGEGDLARLYEVDPQEDEVLVHKPARLTFNPTILKPRDEDEAPREYPEGLAGYPAVVSDTVSGFLDRLNWRFLIPAIAGFAILYTAITGYFNTPTVGVIVGLIPGLIAGYQAEDGELSVEMAPYHYSHVRAVLSKERATYAEAKTWDDILESIGDLELQGIQKSEEMLQVVRKKIRGEMESRYSIPDATGTGDDGSGVSPADD